MQFKNVNKHYYNLQQLLYYIINDNDKSQEPIPQRKNVLDSREEFLKQLAFSGLLIHWSASPQPTR